MKTLAILTPSITKPNQCAEHVETAEATADADVFVYSQWEGHEGYIECLDPNKLIIGPNLGFGKAINLLWKAFPGYRYYMWGSDDVFFEDNHWLDALINKMQQHHDNAIVWPNDSLVGHAPASSLARFTLTSNKVLSKLGYFGLPGLFHWHIDDVMTHLVQCGVPGGYVPESVIYHKHNPAPMPTWWRAEDDTKIYQYWVNCFAGDDARRVLGV